MSENEDAVRGGFFDNAHSGCSRDNDFIWVLIILFILFCCFCGNKSHKC